MHWNTKKSAQQALRRLTLRLAPEVLAKYTLRVEPDSGGYVLAVYVGPVLAGWWS